MHAPLTQLPPTAVPVHSHQLGSHEHPGCIMQDARSKNEKHDGGCGQSSSATHCTHVPPPSHIVPPFCEHGVPFGARVTAGCPWGPHVPGVHSLPLPGTSLGSSRYTTPPAPSQTSEWQSPGVLSAAGVPALTGNVVHMPPAHATGEQNVPG